MNNTVTISLAGREHVVKFGALRLVRKARLENIDFGPLDDPDMSIDQLYVFIVTFVLPKEEHFWENEDELIDALDENSPETLKALTDGFKAFLGFIQTLNEPNGSVGEGKAARRKN